MYTRDQRLAAERLLETSLSAREIARRTGVSRSTIGNWRQTGVNEAAAQRAAREGLVRPLDDAAFAYLLGMYLGDGSIAVSKKDHVFIRFYLDKRYPEIVSECARAIQDCSPARVRRYERAGAGVIILQASGRQWLSFFPQHGAGKKHERRIVLASWQREITQRHVSRFLRGLIHSDGSRVVNRFSVGLRNRVARYEYPRYFFTNYSADIRRIFSDHCEALGIRWTQFSPRNISIADRRSVALLDEFVGPKK